MFGKMFIENLKRVSKDAIQFPLKCLHVIAFGETRFNSSDFHGYEII